MNDTDATNGYFETSTSTCGIWIEAIASSNQRSLDYAKSVWRIAARPYGSKALRDVIRENVDRSHQIAALTVSALRARRHGMAELAEKLAGQIVKRQDCAVASLQAAERRHRERG